MVELIHQEVLIPVGGVYLKGELVIPPHAKAVIVFAHGSGSSRHSPRNQAVAKHLREKGFGTLLFDLLTLQEDMEFERRFDISLLTKRLVGATEWLEAHHAPFKGCIGFFGASTGAAAALSAAALLPQIKAVVSRGGRPDLAGDLLYKVTAPTLLIVGALDEDVVLLNEVAYEKLHGQKKMKLVLGATHLFEEEGKMEEVIQIAEEWFAQWML